LRDRLAALTVRERRKMGSSLKFCMIAEAEADIYLRMGPTCEWDIAAGQAILEAAGGSVTRLDGSPMIYGKADEAYLNPSFIARGLT
jgi:3'(2'), 5'-bisphosphate nucleotidase